MKKTCPFCVKNKNQTFSKEPLLLNNDLVNDAPDTDLDFVVASIQKYDCIPSISIGVRSANIRASTLQAGFDINYCPMCGRKLTEVQE